MTADRQATPNRETAAVLALLRLGGRSDQDYRGLIEQAGSATAALERELVGDGAQTSLLAPDPEPLLQDAATALQGWAARGLRLITILDRDYPSNLREVDDRPPFLFVMGTLAEQDARSVAVIGARRASDEGRDVARGLATDLVDAGWTVVSGLAAGIDTAAHEAALQRDGRTIAVVGTGLHHTYPRQNAELQRRIARSGAVVSQFWPEAPPSKRSFPMRNAVMSGISRGSVIIEASERSGARVQARLALAHGRPVLLHRGLLRQPWAQEMVRQPGVVLVRSAADVMAAVQGGLADEPAQE